MSSSPVEKGKPTPQPMVGISTVPPVTKYHRKQNTFANMLSFSVLILICGWALMLYMGASCVDFDPRGFTSMHLFGGLKYTAGTRAAAPPLPPNLSARDNDPRDVAAEAKSSVREFFELAGNFHCPQPRRYTREEIARHGTADDLWVVIDGNVLDLSTFIHQHPGGLVLLDGAGGQDMAAVFSRFHHPSSVNLFPSFCIGRVAGA